MSLKRTILAAGTKPEGLEQWIRTHENIAWLKEHCNFLQQWLTSDYISCHTSGSTGSPKEIKLPKHWLSLSAQRSLKVLNLPKKAQLLLQLPADKIGGRMMMVRALVGGFDLHILPASSFIDRTRKYDFAAFTPHQLLKSLVKADELDIDQIILGGSQVPDSLEEKILGWKNRVFETYGMTETASHIALRQLNGSQRSEFFKCMDGIQVRAGEEGELWIRFEKESPEIQTKDAVQLKSTSEFKLLGRLDSAINSGGIKHFPETIEKKLASHISEVFFVFGEEDELLGEHLALLIEGVEVDLPEFSKVLEKYEHPKSVYWIQELVRTSNGKINRLASIALLKQS